jgi:hypothetical protein
MARAMGGDEELGMVQAQAVDAGVDAADPASGTVKLFK